MLDQFFSSDNFRNILDYENRKGLNLERKYFPNVFQITQEISRVNRQLREFKVSDESYVAIRNRKKELKALKESMLISELEEISKKVTDKKFKFNITKKLIEGEKPLYTIPDTAESFFTMKQIQYNVSKVYKVKQANRFNIVSQIKNILDDDFPKYIIRTDISEFYESIPHEKLLNKIREDSLLSFFSKRIISKLLIDYREKSGSDKGVPRGIGLSAYLSELYMRGVDDHIRAIPDLIYYARYVDDIIAIFSPTLDNKDEYWNLMKRTIETDYHLTINNEKTTCYDLITNSSETLEYLGYKISFGIKRPICIELTTRKKNKYKTRIDLSIESYNNYSIVNEKKARKVFIKRVKFLTGNTRLVSYTKNVLVGIYYTNILLTTTNDLDGLDRYFRHKCDTLISSETLKNRLLQYSFKKGFNERTFSNFSHSDFTEIVKIWKKR